MCPLKACERCISCFVFTGSTWVIISLNVGEDSNFSQSSRRLVLVSGSAAAAAAAACSEAPKLR